MKRIIACLLTVLLTLQPLSVSATGQSVDSDTFQVEQTKLQTEAGSGTEEGNEETNPTGESTGSNEETDPTGESTGSNEETDPTGESTGSNEETDPTEDGTEEETEPFSCHTFDDQGRQLDGFWSEEEAVWYLFVPSNQSIKDVAIHYSGKITNASVGQLDEENSMITDVFSSNGDKVTLTASDETVYHVVVMQSKLPSVHITLNGVTLNEVHKDKNIKYKKNTISIMDPNGGYDLLVENDVEFKGRGNSTWVYFDKKAYQIKFSEKISVLGMGKSRTWILLANAADETLMRNMLSLNLASEVGMDYVTEFRYVDLWIDGEYLGNYMLGEKVEMGSNRVELEDPYATLFEQDSSFYYDEDYWFYNETMGKYFTVKDTNVDDSDPAQVQIPIDAFQSSLDKLMRYLYSTPSSDVRIAELEKIIDVDSFAKYCLVNEYCGNAEATASSFYAHMDGVDDVVHLGPVWDFDCSMGNYKNEYTHYMSAHVLFNCLLAAPEFHSRTVEIYNEYHTAFAKLSAEAAAIKEEISESATMNFIRWNVWGEPNPKDSLKDYAASYEEGYQRLAAWLYNQATNFAVQNVRIPYAAVDEDGNRMNIFFDNGEDNTPVVFAVWSDKAGQDDLKWYYPEKNAKGVWEAAVDLSAFQDTGKYTIHASTVKDGVRNRVGAGYVYIDKINPPAVSAKLEENRFGIGVTMSGVGKYTDLKVRVWCLTDGDADLREYELTEQENFTWTALIELRNHDELGEYCVQFYGKHGDAWNLLGDSIVEVTERRWPKVTTNLSAAEKKLTVTVENLGTAESLELLIWGEAEGRNDATMYNAAKNADGIWSAVIDLDKHGENGAYQIVIFGVKDNEKNQIATERVMVEGIVFPGETVMVYRLYNQFTHEHLLTANEAEMKQLEAAGWQVDGVAWKAPKTGTAVYRLYNPYDDWHTYTTSQEEIQTLAELGWTVDGIVFASTEAVNRVPVYRLFNPYEKKNYHLLTSSEEEREMLLELGWLLDGVALNAVFE